MMSIKAFIPGLALGTLACGAVAIAAMASGPGAIIARFEIGGNDVAYDYLRADSDGHRLFVAHGTRVEVLSLPDGRKIGEIAGMNGVHGIELVPRLGKGYTSDGLDRKVSVFDLKTLAVERRIGPTGMKPDAIQIDPQSGQLFVVNGGSTGDITVIDPHSDSIVKTLVIGGGKLEQIAFDGRGHAFVNDEQRSVVHVLDTTSLKKTGSWSLAPCEEPSGMAIDRERHRIFSVCGNGKMAVLDSDTGKPVAMLPISGDPDGVAFDSRVANAYVSNREGLLDVFHVISANQIMKMGSVKTGQGARTLAVDAGTGTVYVPTGSFTKPEKGGAPALVAGSFAVLAISPTGAGPAAERTTE